LSFSCFFFLTFLSYFSALWFFFYPNRLRVAVFENFLGVHRLIPNVKT